MNTKSNVVILITIATLAFGCNTEVSPEPGPLERAPSSEPMLTSTVPPAPKQAGLPDQTKQVDPEPELNEVVYEPILQSDDSIVIHRLITATEVDGREPLAASAVFGSHEEKIYAFLDIGNESSKAKIVTVFFVGPSGKVSGGVELDVPANVSRWRTWAFTRFAHEVGLWRVEVRNPAGVLLGALPFEVAEGC
jgi:hypothetical protein